LTRAKSAWSPRAAPERATEPPIRATGPCKQQKSTKCAIARLAVRFYRLEAVSRSDNGQSDLVLHGRRRRRPPFDHRNQITIFRRNL
jgi:hypothetical protein